MRIGRETMRWTPSGITTNAVVFGDPEPRPTPDEPPTPDDGGDKPDDN